MSTADSAADPGGSAAGGADDDSFVAQLDDYECPECGPMADLGYTEREAEDILGGDEHGFTRCPECGSELEPTVEAAVAMLEMVQRRTGLQVDVAAIASALDG